MLARIAKPGQFNPAPRWTVIQCPDECFDKVAILQKTKRLSEAEAILEVENDLDKQEAGPKRKRRRSGRSWRDAIDVDHS